MTGAVRRIHLTVFCAISRAMFCRRSAAVCSFYIFNCKDYIVQNEAHILFSKHTYTYLVVTYHGSKHIFTISLYSVNFHILFFLRFPDWTETFMQHGWNKKKKIIRYCISAHNSISLRSPALLCLLLRESRCSTRDVPVLRLNNFSWLASHRRIVLCVAYITHLSKYSLSQREFYECPLCRKFKFVWVLLPRKPKGSQNISLRSQRCLII